MIKRSVSLLLSIIMIIGLLPGEGLAAKDQVHWGEELGGEENYWQLPEKMKPVSISTADPVKTTSLLYQGKYVNGEGRQVVRLAWRHRQTVKSAYWQKILFRFDTDLVDKIDFEKTTVHGKKGNITFDNKDSRYEKSLPLYGAKGIIEGPFRSKDISIPIDLVLKQGKSLGNEEYLIQTRITSDQEDVVLSTAFGNDHTYSSYTESTVIPGASSLKSSSIKMGAEGKQEGELRVYGSSSFASYNEKEGILSIYYGNLKNSTLLKNTKNLGIRQDLSKELYGLLKEDTNGNVGKIYLAEFDLKPLEGGKKFVNIPKAKFHNTAGNPYIIAGESDFGQEAISASFHDHLAWGSIDLITRRYTVFEYQVDKEKVEELFKKGKYLVDLAAHTEYLVAANTWVKHSIKTDKEIVVPKNGIIRYNFDRRLSGSWQDTILQIGDMTYTYRGYPYISNEREWGFDVLWYNNGNNYRMKLADGMIIPQGTEINIWTRSAATDRGQTPTIELGGTSLGGFVSSDESNYLSVANSEQLTGILIAKEKSLPKIDEIFTDTKNITGHTLPIEADLEAKYKSYKGSVKSSATSEEVVIGGKTFQAYGFDLPVKEIKDQEQTIASLKKDMKLSFRVAKAGLVPGDYKDEQVQAKIDFNLNYIEVGQNQPKTIEKIAPLNEKFLDEVGYTANGFEGANRRLVNGIMADHKGQALKGIELAKREFPGREGLDAYVSDLTRPNNPSLVFLGWSTKADTTQEEFASLELIDNEDKFNDTSKAYKFDETSPIYGPKTLYAVWGKRTIELHSNRNDSTDETIEIVPYTVDESSEFTEVQLPDVSDKKEFTLENKTLIGWSKDPSATEPDQIADAGQEKYVNNGVKYRLTKDKEGKYSTEPIQLYAVYKDYFTIKVTGKDWGSASPRPIKLGLMYRTAVGAPGYEIIHDPLAIHAPYYTGEEDIKTYPKDGGEVVWKVPGYDSTGARRSYVIAELNDNTAKLFPDVKDWASLGIILYETEVDSDGKVTKEGFKRQTVSYPRPDNSGLVDTFTGATVRKPSYPNNSNKRYYEQTGYDISITNTRIELGGPVINQIYAGEEFFEFRMPEAEEDLTEITFTINGKETITLTKDQEGNWVSDKGNLVKPEIGSNYKIEGLSPFKKGDKLVAISHKGQAKSDPITSTVAEMELSSSPKDLAQGVKDQDGNTIITGREGVGVLGNDSGVKAPLGTRFELVKNVNGQWQEVEDAKLTQNEKGELRFSIPSSANLKDGDELAIRQIEPRKKPSEVTKAVKLDLTGPEITLEDGVLKQATDKFNLYPKLNLPPYTLRTNEVARIELNSSTNNLSVQSPETVKELWPVFMEAKETVSQGSFTVSAIDKFGNTSQKTFQEEVGQPIKENPTGQTPAGFVRITFDGGQGNKLDGSNQKIVYDLVKGISWKEVLSIKADFVPREPSYKDDTMVFKGSWTKGAEKGLKLPPADLEEKIEEDLSFLAEYMLPEGKNIIDGDSLAPGEAPRGYVKFTFHSGDNGDLGEKDGVKIKEKLIYINPKAGINYREMGLPSIHANSGYEVDLTQSWYIEKAGGEKIIIDNEKLLTKIDENHDKEVVVHANIKKVLLDNPSETPEGYVKISFNAGDKTFKGGSQEESITILAGKTLKEIPNYDSNWEIPRLPEGSEEKISGWKLGETYYRADLGDYNEVIETSISFNAIYETKKNVQYQPSYETLYLATGDGGSVSPVFKDQLDREAIVDKPEGTTFTVEPNIEGISIDANTGEVTITSSYPGGEVSIKVQYSDGTEETVSLSVKVSDLIPSTELTGDNPNPKSYVKLTMDPNGGSHLSAGQPEGSSASEEFYWAKKNSSQTIDFGKSRVVQDGKKFKFWADSKGADTEVSNPIKVGQVDKSLYAIWSEDRNLVKGSESETSPGENYVKLNLDKNDEKANIKGEEFYWVKKGAKIEANDLKESMAELTNHRFIRWAKDTTGGQLPLENIQADSTLYAIYDSKATIIGYEGELPVLDNEGKEINKEEYISISFKTDGNGSLSLGDLTGKASLSALVKKGSNWTAIELPTTSPKENYSHWYWSGPSTGQVTEGQVRTAYFITDGQEITSDKDRTLPEGFYKVRFARDERVKDNPGFKKVYGVKAGSKIDQAKFPTLEAQTGSKDPSWDVETPWNEAINSDRVFMASGLSSVFDSDKIEKMEITSQPTKKTYSTGEDFDPSGIKITLTDQNGNTKEVGPEEFSIYGLSLEGDKNLQPSAREIKVKKQGLDDLVITGITVTDKEATSLSDVKQAGNTITGKTEAGAEVTVTDNQGNQIDGASVKVNDDGSFTVTLPEDLADGTQVKVLVTKDGKAPVEEIITLDKKAPGKADLVQPHSGDEKVTVKLPKDEDNPLEVGDKILVNVGDVTKEYTLTDEDLKKDSIEIALDSALTKDQKVKVEIKDQAGNVSDPAEMTVSDKEATSLSDVKQEGNTITGTAEQGAKVSLVDENGRPINDSEGKPITVIAEADGYFNIKLPADLADGTTVKVLVTKEGKAPAEETITLDKKAPAKPEQVQAHSGDEKVTVTLPKDGDNPLEVGDKILVTVGEGSEAVTKEHTITDTDITKGQVSVEVPALEKDQKVTVEIKDQAGNVSDPAEGKVTDKTASSLSDVKQVGNTITGKTEPGAEVKVTDGQGKEITGAEVTVNEDGSFTVTLPENLADGDKVKVIVTKEGKAPAEETITLDKKAPGKPEPKPEPGQPSPGKPGRPGKPSTPITPPAKKEDVTVEIIAGADRFDTAVEISKKAFDQSDVVVLAAGRSYPDSLVASVLAAKLKAPLLLVEKDSIPANVMAEIQRLGAKKVYIAGGAGTIAMGLEKGLERDGYTTLRLFGKDRYQTSEEIAKHLMDVLGVSKDQLIFADGRQFADALAISPYAGKTLTPILLVDRNLSSYAKTLLAQANKAIISGGPNSVSPAVEKDIKTLVSDTERISGKDRYGTAEAIRVRFFQDATTATLASGEVYPDALAGSVLAIKKDAPMLLVRQAGPTQAQVEAIKDSKIKEIFIFGGSSTVAPAAAAAFRSIVR